MHKGLPTQLKNSRENAAIPGTQLGIVLVYVFVYMNVKLCVPKFHEVKCAIESSVFEAAGTRAISNSVILHF